jgi:hypothetical protein
MALLFLDSFDHYQTAQILAKWTNAGAAGPGGIVPGQGRCNTQAIQLGANAFVTKGLTFGSTTGIFGFAFKPTTQVFNESNFAFVLAPTGSGLQLNLVRHLDGSIAIVRTDASPVVLATSAPDTVKLGSYYYLEWKVTIDNVAGAVDLHVNGVSVCSAGPVDTQSDLTLSNVLSGVALFGGASFLAYFDDVYVVDSTGPAPWNTFLGDTRVEYLRPDGPGAHQDWDVVGAATHWQAVDDNATPDGDTSYIHTATVALTDTETYQSTGLPSGAIFGLQVNLYARKTDSGLRQIAPVIRHAGADHTGVSVQPSFASYTYLIQTYATNPGTGVSWTIADVNAVEAGVTVVT